MFDCPVAPNQKDFSATDIAKTPPKILDNVLDLGSTIANILTICGIDPKKATVAVSSITSAFMDFDEQQNGMFKTRHMKKGDLVRNLRGNCCMTEAEARLTASVVKCAFRAFYHKQSLRKYDPGFYSENDWNCAAARTIASYAKAGATKSELELAATRIQEAYKGYLDRVEYKFGPRNKIDCDALVRENCYKCSPQAPESPKSEPCEASHQVVCTCCGCLKASPVSYRDGKGRSILLVEDNNLYYNTQVMKNELDKIQATGECEKVQEPTCQENLSKALYKLTQDMINRVIQCGRVGEMLRGVCDDNILKLSGQKTTESQMTQTKENDEAKGDSDDEKSSADCECRGKYNAKKKGKKRGSAIISGLRTPPNSYDDQYDDYHTKSKSDALIEINLKGIYKCKSGRPKIDIVGLKLLENEFADPSEFICKRRVGVKNRYTQTGGSAGESANSSCASSHHSDIFEEKRSKVSISSKSSKATTKKRSPSISHPPSVRIADDSGAKSLAESADDADNQDGESKKLEGGSMKTTKSDEDSQSEGKQDAADAVENDTVSRKTEANDLNAKTEDEVVENEAPADAVSVKQEAVEPEEVAEAAAEN